MPRRTLLSLAAFVLGGLAAGAFALVQGVSAGRPLFGFLGALILACVALFVLAVARTRWQQRGMTAEERDAQYARRLEEVRRRRPAWRDSPWWAGVMVLFAAYWGWHAVRAVRAEVWWLAVVDGTLCLAMLWSAVRVLRRRRVSSDS